MSPQEHQEQVADAGEYVIGTLTGAERQAFEARMQADAALQREVHAWQDRLLGLTARLTPVALPPQLWPRIAARLGAGPLFQAPTQGGATASGAPAAANDPAWSGVRFWQLVSGLSMAAAVVMASVLVSQRLPGHDPAHHAAQALAPRYLAVLQNPDKPGAGWVVETVASADTQPGEAAIRLVPLGPQDEIPEGKTMQFWTKPEGAKGPTSLGLVKPGQVVVVPVRQLPGLAERTLFELTLEPAGGSPYPKPSGPILYVGRAVKV